MAVRALLSGSGVASGLCYGPPPGVRVSRSLQGIVVRRVQRELAREMQAGAAVESYGAYWRIIITRDYLVLVKTIRPNRAKLTLRNKF